MVIFINSKFRFRQKAKPRRAEDEARDQRAYDLRHLELLRNETQDLGAQQDQRKIQQKMIRHSISSTNSLKFQLISRGSILSSFLLFSTVRIDKEMSNFLHFYERSAIYPSFSPQSSR